MLAKELHPVLLTLSTGRTGTVFLYNAFRSIYSEDEILVLHETLNGSESKMRRYFRCIERDRITAALDDPDINYFIGKISKYSESTGPVLIFGNTLSHLCPIFDKIFKDRLRILLIHRNPVVLAASSYCMTEPSWWEIPPFNLDYYGKRLTPSDPHVVFSRLSSRWHNLNLFQKSLYNQLERMNSYFDFLNIYNNTIKLVIPFQELVGQKDKSISRIARLVNIEPRIPTLETVNRNEMWRRTIEKRPFRFELLDDALTWPELEIVYERMEESVSENELILLLQKYTIPDRLGSRIRHSIRYWDRRESVVSALRKCNLLRARRVDIGASPE